MQHTGRACNPCYLKYEKERRGLSTYVAFGRDFTEKPKTRKKRAHQRNTPKHFCVPRWWWSLFLSFFSLFVVLRSSGIMGFITSAYRVCARAAAARRGACVPRRVLFEASSNVLIGAGAFPVFGDHALRRFHLGGNV